MLKSRMWECPECSHYFDGLIDDADRDEGTECPICEAECGREDELITAPNLLQKSYHMGRKDGIMDDLREANKLEQKAMSLPNKEKNELMQEVTRIKNPRKAKQLDDAVKKLKS